MYDPDEHMEEVDIDPLREVERLYIMIEDWIGGIRTDLSPLTDSLAEDFTLVGPDGAVRDRETFVEAMRDAGERYRGSDPPYVIDIQNGEVQQTVDDRYLVTFELFERIDGEWQARTASCWLREQGKAGVELLHLHQTWLEAPGPDADDDATAGQADDERETPEEADTTDDAADTGDAHETDDAADTGDAHETDDAADTGADGAAAALEGAAGPGREDPVEAVDGSADDAESADGSADDADATDDEVADDEAADQSGSGLPGEERVEDVDPDEPPEYPGL